MKEAAFLFLSFATLAVSFNRDWVWNLNYSTSKCMTGCIKKYENSYYCINQVSESGRCCHNKATTSKCQTQLQSSYFCSEGAEYEELHYQYCVADEDLCGRRNRFAEVNVTTIELEDLRYSTNDLCTYRVFVDLTTASQYEFITIGLDFLAGADFSIYTGEDLASASNQTLLTPETSEMFPIKNDDGNINFIYIGIVPYEGVTNGRATFWYQIFQEPPEPEPEPEDNSMPLWAVLLIVFLCLFCALGFIGWKIYQKIKIANMREKAWEVNRRHYGGNATDWANQPGGVIKFEDTATGKVVVEEPAKTAEDRFRELPKDYMPPIWPVGAAHQQSVFDPKQLDAMQASGAPVQRSNYYLDGEAKERRKNMFAGARLGKAPQDETDWDNQSVATAHKISMSTLSRNKPKKDVAASMF